MKTNIAAMDKPDLLRHHAPDLTPFLSGPLHIDFVVSPLGGALGLTHCPGRNQVDSKGRAWCRNLSDDLDAVIGADISTLITFLDQQELERLGASALPEMVQKYSFRWIQLPITDFGVPATDTVFQWCELLESLLDQLRQNKRILLHCAAGMGRSGMMAATLLKATGQDADDAIRLICKTRPGTVETLAQEQFVRDFKWMKTNV